MNGRYSPIGAIAPLLLVLLISTLSAQEFPLYPNGLIYHDSTVTRLRTIVDSLNLKFRQCDPAGPYLALPQGEGNYVQFTGTTAELRTIIAMLERRVPYQRIVQEQKRLIMEDRGNIPIIKFIREDNHPAHGAFRAIHGSPYNTRVNLYSRTIYTADTLPAGTWIYQLDTTSYNRTMLYSFYIVRDICSRPIPERYARLIQYVDCMVDTTTDVYTAHRPDYYNYPDDAFDSLKALPALRAMLDYPGRPKFDYSAKADDSRREDFRRYSENTEAWRERRSRFIADTLVHQERFRDLLAATVEELLRTGLWGDAEVEQLVEEHISKKAALGLKRNRRPMGSCSQDLTPRYHALRISMLAAETASWDIFLRAHLDIMNDNFARATDGSYAYGSRGTYIRELEMLDINVLDLMLGISLQCANTTPNHYYGSIARTGRALQEFGDQAAFESKIFAMMSDAELDEYNRRCLYVLYESYIYSFDAIDVRAAKIRSLQERIGNLPEHLHQEILALKPIPDEE